MEDFKVLPLSAGLYASCTGKESRMPRAFLVPAASDTAFSSGCQILVEGRDRGE